MVGVKLVPFGRCSSSYKKGGWARPVYTHIYI